MCELLAMVGPRPFAVLDAVPLASGVERWGIAGMSWGAAWVDAASGALRHYKRDVALRDDGRAEEALHGAMTTTLFIHLRRPSLLSTLSMADAQPFASDDPPFIFAHNGDFKRHEEYRPRYAGLLRGRADTEVAFQHLVELRREHEPVEALLRLQDELQGNNNLLYLDGDGRLFVYATGEENAMYRFRQGDRYGIVTSLYSADRAVFDLVMPDAEYLGDIPIGRPEVLAVGQALPPPGVAHVSRKEHNVNRPTSHISTLTP
jgi:predicted glutamine amidotransferase